MSDHTGRPVAIIGAVRSPLGRHDGALSNWNPADLLGETIITLLCRVGIPADAIDEVIVGCSTPAGAQARNLARRAGLAAGLPDHVPAQTVDDGHRALRAGAATIAAGLADVVLVGGIDITSLVPANALTHDLPRGPSSQLLARRYDTWSHPNPALIAEALARHHNLSRDQLDDYALDSHTRARTTVTSGAVAISPPAGPLASDAADLDHDELLDAAVSAETLCALAPTYQRDGKITRGNTAPPADGAAAALLASTPAAKQLGLTTIATICATTAGATGTIGLTGHIAATHRALAAADLTPDQLDTAHVDETFAATALAWQQTFDVDLARINPTGGSLATGIAPGATPIGQLADLLATSPRESRTCGLISTANTDGTGTTTILQIHPMG